MDLKADSSKSIAAASEERILELQLKRRIRLLLIIFITGLALSGLTAFPIQSQLEFAHQLISRSSMHNDFTRWIEIVYKGVTEMDTKYSFISYGTDWLGFAHLVIALVFVGPLRDPLKNIWVIQFGLMACAGVFPLAFIAGELRGIPLFWRLIDCSFGLLGGVVLWLCYRKVVSLERLIIRT